MSTDSATENWYLEIKDYDFSNKGVPKNFHKVGHFTQVVWKKSTKLGCGIAKGTVVCHYCEEAGNFGSDYGSNVLPFKEPAGGTPVVDAKDDPPKPEPEVVDDAQRADGPEDKFSPADGELTITKAGFVDGYCNKRYPK